MCGTALPVLAVELSMDHKPSGGFTIHALRQDVCHHILAFARLCFVQGGLQLHAGRTHRLRGDDAGCKNNGR